ncbi:hypothetical protein [Saccharothrix deserti]|uniref:hypothetical protein n=1 Tax=Saccharothrix deserti TaxID=2593674 RepID=UPI00131AAA6A|nr:hypothetical protein [Saccharothrix deserti]
MDNTWPVRLDKVAVDPASATLTAPRTDSADARCRRSRRHPGLSLIAFVVPDLLIGVARARTGAAKAG